MKIHWKKPQPLIILRDQKMLRYESRTNGDIDDIKRISFRPYGEWYIQFKDGTYTHANKESLSVVK